LVGMMKTRVKGTIEGNKTVAAMLSLKRSVVVGSAWC
jgi:hypothetical protein